MLFRSAVAIPYNGSVARINFGAAVARRVRRWLEANNLDLLHIHEPIAPNIGILALQAAMCPVVATFHAAMDRSVARELLSPMTGSFMEKISATIAVSEEARRTLIHYHGGDAVVIPNGVNVSPFAAAPKDDPANGTATDLVAVADHVKSLYLLIAYRFHRPY